MDYVHITQFLDKFKKILFQKEESNRVIAQIIKKYIRKDIEERSVSIKGTVIHVKGSPMLHNEILIHKQEILRDVSQMLHGRVYTDIR